MNLPQLLKQINQRSFPLDFPGHWVTNQWLIPNNAKAMQPSLNPNNGEVLLTCRSDKSVMVTALEQAEEVRLDLARSSLESRFAHLQKMRLALADYRVQIIDCLSLEGGKPIWEASAEFDAALQYLDDFTAQPDVVHAALLGPISIKTSSSQHMQAMPIGSVVAYLPFSTPVMSFAKYFAAAITAGCPLIICPSLHCSLTGTILASLIQSLELPKGSCAVIFGTFEVFQSTIADRRIQAIIYTGSREHCELIRRESRGVPGRQLMLQSGGKNAALIHSSADLATAVETAITGAFRGCGQLCSSTSRIFVHKSLLAEFCTQLLNNMQHFKIGRTDNPSWTDVRMGPLYSEKAVDKFLRYQTMAHREAKSDLLWGKELEDTQNGFLVSPGIHLMKSFDASSSIQSNVLFCPDLAIYEYEVLDSAVEMINSTDAPYCVSLVGDASILNERAHLFAAPNLFLNLPTVTAENTPTVAGKYYSGHHRFSGLGLSMLLSYPQVIHSA